MPTTDTMDTHMPTTHMPTMARDLLMLSQRPRLMLMLTTDTTICCPPICLWTLRICPPWIL